MSLEDTVEMLLKGEGLEVTELHFAPEQKKPVTRKNTCFAVCAVIFNSKNEVLMIQEPKAVCLGSWYLPAGRMEDGESIEEALKREVKEEAGIDCQPITMLQIQEKGPSWIRFAFLAEKTGGSLKTPEEANADSLQAQWYDRESLPKNIRKRDILTLIDAGIRYRQSPWFSELLPVDFPCDVVCQRLLLAFTSRDANPENGDEEHVWLLLSKDSQLPVAASIEAQTLAFTAKKLVKYCMPSIYEQLSVNTCGILGVQHNGRAPGQTDGVCLNTFVQLEYKEEEEEISLSSPPKPENAGFRWHEVTNQSLRTEILQKIQEGSVLPVQSI
ncbi:8-oxo-dGDP phosphatase NUDT18-like [Sinocyclocheilus rhinocerous]|uniref:8-oxo-dGDP phosphatase NUDT18-like n=1 Tax=Sinocyclocheilus rhinocerous TaxID=307959 RepID=A0A673MN04_9TELE|nr:PREDICTED: 8-oxo-dGDP phosphatase NUDT18-like [Sinocyclocheilus rhinocerous]